MEKINSENILIIEDDQSLTNLTKEYLEKNGMTVSIEHKGSNAASRILNEHPDVVILDLRLPGENGISICQSVRSRYCGGILMLTAQKDDMDEILGLEIGADDYVTKPVLPRILLARIRALIRRNHNYSIKKTTLLSTRLMIGNIIIDKAMRTVWVNKCSIDLTSAEFDLLWLLCTNAGQILSRETIFERLRGIEYNGQDRSIDVRVSRIRLKIGDNPTQPHLIKTVRSKGYLFVKPLDE